MLEFTSLEDAQRYGFEIVADYDDCFLLVRTRTPNGYAMALCRRPR